MNKIKEAIACSRFAEFPDVLVTLELNRAFAAREKRSVPQSLRAGARALIPRIQHPLLRETLEAMSTSQFPEVQIARIRDCIKRMESALNRAQKKFK
mgnify:FL=1